MKALTPFLRVVCLALLASACGAPLGPARDILGTWETEFAVRFTYEKNTCPGGQREVFGAADLTMRLVIDPVEDGTPNDVWMGFTELTESNWRPDTSGTCLGGGTSSGYDIMLGPIKATISASAIAFDDKPEAATFVGSFTTDFLMGNLSRYRCFGESCAGYRTVGNELKFVRQR